MYHKFGDWCGAMLKFQGSWMALSPATQRAGKGFSARIIRRLHHCASASSYPTVLVTNLDKVELF